MTTSTESPYLTISEAAAYLRIAMPTLRSWRARGQGPPSLLAGGRVLYDSAELDAWLRSEREKGGAEG